MDYIKIVHKKYKNPAETLRLLQSRDFTVYVFS
jgi:hypothetical protein